MSLHFRIVLQALVGVFVFSTVTSAAPSATVQSETLRESANQVLPQNPLEGVSISNPQFRMSQADLRLDWEKIWRLTSVQFGYVSGELLASSEENTESWALGLTRTNYNRNDTAQEYGLNLISNEAFQLHWSFKIFDFHSGWTRFTKFGLALNAETRDGLASPLDPDRYAIMLGLGLEESRTYRSSFRPDLTLMYGNAGLAFQLSVLVDVEVLEALASRWW
jgi:hypothetical protein